MKKGKAKIRQLTEQEKLITMKNIAIHKETLKELDYEIRNAKLIIERGLQVNLEQLQQEYMEKLNLLKASPQSKWVAYQIDYYTLQLNEGLDFKTKQELKRMKQKLRDFEQEVNEIKFTIEVAEKQLKDGVEAR
jgi:hypothetical protein